MIMTNSGANLEDSARCRWRLRSSPSSRLAAIASVILLLSLLPQPCQSYDRDKFYQRRLKKFVRFLGGYKKEWLERYEKLAAEQRAIVETGIRPHNRARHGAGKLLKIKTKLAMSGAAHPRFAFIPTNSMEQLGEARPFQQDPMSVNRALQHRQRRSTP